MHKRIFCSIGSGQVNNIKKIKYTALEDHVKTHIARLETATRGRVKLVITINSIV